MLDAERRLPPAEERLKRLSQRDAQSAEHSAWQSYTQQRRSLAQLKKSSYDKGDFFIVINSIFTCKSCENVLQLFLNKIA